MENYEKKDAKKQYFDEKGQKFYFDDEGKLVVESNKGVWNDGEPYVKMYGYFSCNAKTLGIIINKFKGCPVVVSDIIKQEYFRMESPFNGSPVMEVSAIVEPSDEDKGLLSKIERYEARNENMGVQVKNLKEEIKEKQELAQKYYLAIDKFNNLPWWKRMFKKIEVK